MQSVAVRLGEHREPVLDGIRGVAILLVLFHHVVIFSGLARNALIDRVVLAVGASAWIGVDLFFALSGFLITGILYDARSSPRYFVSFYGRRVLRIFPLYYGFLCVWLILAGVFETRMGAHATDGLGWHWLFLSNFQVASYGWQDPLHLGHFWSLAVEEQFYLVWPLAVRTFDRQRLIQICLVCFVAAFTIRVIAPFGLTPLGAYVLMPTRMDCLAAGALVALVARGPEGLRGVNAWARVLLTACATLTAAIFLWRKGFPDIDPFISRVGLPLFAVGSASLIALSLTSAPKSSLRRALSAVPLTVLGQYSYGLYVIHQPVALLLRDAGWQVGVVPSIWGSQLPGLAVFGAVVCLVSAVCAIASWHLLEAPFLRLRRYLPYERQPERLAGSESTSRLDVNLTLRQP